MFKIRIGFALALVFANAPAFSQSQNPGVQVTGAPANNDCAKFVVSGGNVNSITTAGAGCGGTQPTGANPTATAGPNAVNGSATTYMRSDAAPPIQLGSSSQPGLIQCGTGTTCSGGTMSVAPSTSIDAGGATTTVANGTAGDLLQITGTSPLYVNKIAPASLTANPTATIGLSAINGSAATSLRSDAAPALSQAIAPTWTGLHTWSGGGILTSGAPPQTVSATTNPYMGGNTSSWIVIPWAAASATEPEVANECIGTSAVGSANAGTAFKLCSFNSMTVGSGSADGYAGNEVVQANSGFTGLLTGHEIDLNWDAGAAAGAIGSTSAAYNLVLAGTAASASYSATAAIWLTGVGANASTLWQYGMYISNGPTTAGIIDSSNASYGIYVGGTHASAALAVGSSPGATTKPVAIFTNTHATSGDYGVFVGIGSTATTDTSLLMTWYDASLVHTLGNIGRNGASYGVNYNTTSDARLKENIRPFAEAIETVMNITPRHFNYIGSDVRQDGFVAQELYAEYPQCVTVGGDDPMKNPWMVDKGCMTPLAIAAIQAEQREIDALTARVAAVEQNRSRLTPSYEEKIK
jgi:hypothetical protein